MTLTLPKNRIEHVEKMRIICRQVIAENPIPAPAQYDAELRELDAAQPVSV
jgi:hypothetical protein